MDPLRQVHHFLEEAVEAMANQHTALQRLDVDVARLALDRALHDEIDEVDDRRGLAALLQTDGRLEHFVFDAAHQRGVRGRVAGRVRAALACRYRRGELRTGGARANAQGFVGISGLYRLEDVAARGDDLLDPVSRLELEVLDQAEEQRVGHGHGEQVLFEPNRDAHPLQRHFLCNQNNRLGIRRILSEVDVWKPELEGERLRNLLLGGEIQPDEYYAEAFSRPLVLSERGPEIVFGDEAGLDQALTNLLAHYAPLRDIRLIARISILRRSPVHFRKRRRRRRADAGSGVQRCITA
jgi:hypothetical protein